MHIMISWESESGEIIFSAPSHDSKKVIGICKRAYMSYVVWKKL